MNSFHIIFHPSRKSQRGATTLVISTLLIMAAGLLVIFAASFSRMQQKITQNQYDQQQAFTAADAGLEYSIGVLYDYYNCLVNSTGCATPCAISGTLSNNSSYCVNFSLPTAITNPPGYAHGNYTPFNEYIVTSIGYSADGTASRTVKQMIGLSPYETSTVNYIMDAITMQYNYPLPPYWYAFYPVFALGNVSASGNTQVVSVTYTIAAGGTITLSGNAQTIVTFTGFTYMWQSQNPVNSGTPTVTQSTSIKLKPDTNQGSIILAQQTVAGLFEDLFAGETLAEFASEATHNFAAGSSDYSSVLNGLTGTIYVNAGLSGGASGNATLSGTITSFWNDNGIVYPVCSTTIGTSNNPVMLVVNGNLVVSGCVTINGLVFTTGNVSSPAPGDFNTNYLHVAGFVYAGGNITTGGNAWIGSLQNAVQATGPANPGISYIQPQFAAVVKYPGSWKDF